MSKMHIACLIWLSSVFVWLILMSIIAWVPRWDNRYGDKLAIGSAVYAMLLVLSAFILRASIQ